MAAKVPPWLLPIFYFLAVMSQSSSAPQNIETFYPLKLTPLLPPPPLPSPRPPPDIIPFSPPPPQTAISPPSSTKGKIAKAVGATAAGTVFLSALFFFLLVRYTNKKKETTVTKPNPYADPYPGLRREPRENFARFNSRVKGVIVDEDGLDVLYWKRLEAGEVKSSGFNKQFLRNSFVKDEGKRQSKKDGYLPVQERPLLRGMSSTSHLPDQPEKEDTDGVAFSPEPPTRSSSEITLASMVIKDSPPPPPLPPPPPQTQSVPPPPPPPRQTQSVPPPPPPQPPSALQEKSQFSAVRKEAPQPAPPPPPPIPKTPVPPLPPINKKGPAAPPPPPPHSKPPGSTSTSKPPPPPPRGTAAQASSSGTEIDSNGHVKMKPLHWDKVNPSNVEHSMVWHGLQKGSFKVDDDLMEALFGYVATNRKSPKRGDSSSAVEKSTQSSSQIFILDPRKSQNIAIVVRSLGVSKRELVDSIIDGHGLNVETLERLTRIAPNPEEEAAILQFNGDPEKLADAESFLYHLLKSIPTAFARLNAMFFRANYVPETLFLKESLQTLEKACKELRTRGLFLKLLEAILKAGNRMNAGTTRGNAQAFNLTALRKLSDVKSIDGKTTLLYFVVEEVVRAEGKRCLINRNRSISRTNSQASSNTHTQNSNNSTTSNQDKEKEYIMLGLPVVGGLSSEFGTVKKAATMDYDTLAKTYPALNARLNEIRQILDKIKKSGGGDERVGFVKEMKSFLDLAEEELRVLKQEQDRVMEIVKKTTDYYQTGTSKENEANPLQLFVIIKDFLTMVDQTCIEIVKNMQKKRSSTSGSNDVSGGAGVSSTSTSTSKDPVDRRSVRFPKLPPNFMSEKSNGSDGGSSESDDDYTNP